MKRTALAASALALADGLPVSEYKASFDAVPRAMKDEGALLSGYGLKGYMEFIVDKDLQDIKEVLWM